MGSGLVAGFAGVELERLASCASEATNGPGAWWRPGCGGTLASSAWGASLLPVLKSFNISTTLTPPPAKLPLLPAVPSGQRPVIMASSGKGIF